MQAAAQAAMEARDKLQEDLTQSHHSLAALQEQCDQAVADLAAAASTAATSLPDDLDRIQELSDQVTGLLLKTCSLSCGFRSFQAFER